MVQENEQYAYFAVYNSFDPNEVTARVGLLPTECWQQGDTCPRTQRERRFSAWTLHSRLDRSQELEAHIQDVLDQLSVSSEAIAAVSQEFGGVMQLVGYFHRDYPGLHFTPDITEGLARFALAVDFDFYGLYSHRRECT
jgi:hypothetical protein